MYGRKTLSEIASDRIKEYIAEKNYQPGDRLPSEKEIIDMLGVSRTIVREALKTLQSQGWIEIKQGLGIFVSDIQLESIIQNMSPFITFDFKRMKDVIDTRIVLELGAIELVIEHDQIDNIKELVKWNESYLKKALRGEIPKKEDMFFHQSLFKATNNETYIQLSSFITKYFDMSQSEEKISVDEYKAAYEEHKMIIDLIFLKKKEEAKQVMRQHLQPLYNRLKVIK
ncbi:FadR/GntR family transcriptional regulator [Pseudogracilibacillus auburnensis]|uniref:FadR/GntR family transcriptional regulator n=1 Tax=Pseudogracilibacillus auburnensis TaxID=1494959 RepID=UPI001A9673E0|nr:FadR/GntR family transcriptional regulator [Pseudogracilibacillus auburnensis]MBO1004824.1 FadR family transcriptional regulator [Pseudogracilibacillus auburnensis]